MFTYHDTQFTKIIVITCIAWYRSLIKTQFISISDIESVRKPYTYLWQTECKKLENVATKYTEKPKLENVQFRKFPILLKNAYEPLRRLV